MNPKLLVCATGLACLSIAGTAAADPPAAAPAASSIPATPPVTAPTASTTDKSASVTADPRPKTETTLYMSRGPNRFFLYTGLLTLAGTYVVTAVVAANDGSNRDKDLYIPVVGPWTNLAGRHDTATGDAVLIVGSGILQGVGAGMFVASLFMKEKFATATINAGSVTVTPTASLGGVGAVGTF